MRNECFVMKMKPVRLLYLVVIASFGFVLANSLKCDRVPEGSSANKSPPDGRYKLKIHNDPVRYIPGEIYNISLEGTSRFGQAIPHKFTGFFITVEKDYSDRLVGPRSENESVGKFDIVGSLTAKFSEKCKDLVTHTSSFPKNEILVSWTAPPPGSGCLVFKSTVIEHRDVWYSDDGSLSRSLCEDEANSGDTQPLILDVCTACEEAKYELTFEGLWSRHTHPKDFPDNGWLTKFSDIIGASHENEFWFWTYGQPASEGLKQLAEHGSTGELEGELKKEGEHIRTIIKARGISYPNVTGKTFAVFRVDSKHHLVSLVSMIYPSPDWFVGVSGLELCLSNGSWVDQKILNLYPYDAGTDSGPTYISPDQPTLPKEAIRRIKPNQPNDPRSPFHDAENREMKPLARLYLTRQRLYEKNCENREENSDQEPETDRPTMSRGSGKKCAVSEWSDWTECDSLCGQGKRTRTREYLNPDDEDNCNKPLEKSENCLGVDTDCSGSNNDEEEEKPSNEVRDPTPGALNCELTDWSDFTDCSKQCGKGERTRTREYVNSKNHKRCQKRNMKELVETEECEGQSCAGDIDDKPKKKNNKQCPLGKYSPWSKCSTKCGIGEKIRVAIPNPKQKKEDNLQMIIKLHRKLSSQGNRYNDDDDDDDDEDDENELSDFDILDIADPDHPCYSMPLVEREPCGNKNRPCDDDSSGVPSFCSQKPLKKVCGKESEVRWYYKSDTQSCGIFPYTGCLSNSNNFETELQCLQTCTNNIKQNSNELQSQSLLSGKVDCKVSHWKHEPCNATCGEGVRLKFRSILKHPENGGRPCPRSLVHFERCYKDCGQSRAISEPSSGNSVNLNHHHHHQCRYSNWSAWSPCSKSCGDFGVQIRTRTVLNHLHSHLCNERLEERRCEVMPCLVGSGYSYNYNYRS